MIITVGVVILRKIKQVYKPVLVLYNMHHIDEYNINIFGMKLCCKRDSE